MEALIERCAGLDVHQATVVACVRVSAGGTRTQRELRTFGTMTHQLEELRDWLSGQGVTHVAMESTGVYWRCVYAVLEGHFELIVGNAHHIRNVPGRKTDMKDAAWIAELLSHGLIRSSFVPPRPLRELRELTRYRRRLSELQAAERNRLIRLLESANLKLASVLSDVFGVSGRDILRALIKGEDTPETMADLARGRLRAKRDELVAALHGRLDETQRFLLRMQLQRVEATERQIEELDARIETMIAPYRTERDRLTEIPGLDTVLAAALIAEIGVDMSVFQSANHLAAWAGVCPGSHESAGRRKRTGKRQGNVHLTTVVYSAAQTGVRTKGSYFRDKFHRLKARRGAKRATMAIGHKILLAAYHMLSRQAGYRELGEAYLDQLDQQRVVTRLKRRIEQMGFAVTLVPNGSTPALADRPQRLHQAAGEPFL